MASLSRNKIKVIIVGACGRMGGALYNGISEVEDMEVIYGIERSGHPKQGTAFGKNFITDRLEDVIKEADCIVDFSQPQAVIQHLEVVVRNKKPWVGGVTGFTSEEFEKLKAASETIPLLYSSNFSLGVNLMFKIVRDLAEKFPKDYDVKIIETHHKMKRDSPSGTAKNLAGIIEEIRQEKPEVFSLRAGEVVGEHKVLFFGPGEVLEISHSALSRMAFVRGVIEGIRFIVNKPKGYYTFLDILK